MPQVKKKHKVDCQVISPLDYRIGFHPSKTINEIIEHGQVLDRQILELHSASPRAECFPRRIQELPIIYLLYIGPCLRG